MANLNILLDNLVLRMRIVSRARISRAVITNGEDQVFFYVGNIFARLERVVLNILLALHLRHFLVSYLPLTVQGLS